MDSKMYRDAGRGVNPCTQCKEKIKQKTDWGGMLHDLFGIEGKCVCVCVYVCVKMSVS